MDEIRGKLTQDRVDYVRAERSRTSYADVGVFTDVETERTAMSADLLMR